MTRGERGSGTALIAAAVLVTVAVTGVVAVVMGYLIAAHAARGAADLVALSGAAAQLRGADACRAARAVAAANRVTVLGCGVRGDVVDFVVSVTVARRVESAGFGLPDRVSASAHAGRAGLG